MPQGEEDGGKIHEILFDSPYALEEIYCITFQLLDRVWDEMGAGYMDFPKVIQEGAQRRRSHTFDATLIQW